MAKVAIYARVSTLNQAEEGYSINGQVESLTKYCEVMEWDIFETYIDGGFSGGKLERPAMNRLIIDAKMKKFDTILIYKLDRLSRNVKDTLYLVKDVFSNNNINFVSLKENIDTSTAMGSLFLTLLSAIAEFEREQITERFMFGKLGRAKSGKPMTWANPPFGYIYDKNEGRLIGNQADGVVVRKLFDYYISGMSIASIIRKINSEEYTGRDAPWTIGAMKSVLQNEVYYGMVKYRNELYEGNHEPYISKEIFELAQIERNRRREYTYNKFKNTRPFRAKYMLSGLLKCGCCGKPLVSNVQRPRQDGSERIMYQCRERYNKDLSLRCTRSKRFKKEVLEEHVLSELTKIKMDHRYLDNKTQSEPKVDTKRLKDEIRKLDRKLEKLSELYIEGMISKDSLKEKSERFIKQIDFINKQIIVNESASKDDEIKVIKKTIEEWQPNFSSYEDTALVVRKLVKYIEVDENKIEITLNF